jgi:hypothetical protein
VKTREVLSRARKSLLSPIEEETPMNDTVHFSAFKLPSDGVFDAYATGDTEKSLDGLGVVNLFVGPNNSGKSRFLRALFATQDLHYTTNAYDAATFSSFVARFTQSLHDIVPRQMVSVGGVTKEKMEELQRRVAKPHPRFIPPTWNVPDMIRECVQMVKDFDGPPGSNPPTYLREKVHHIRETVCEEYSAIPWDPTTSARKRFYVPILRGMRPLPGAQRDCYHERTVSDYFKTRGVRPEDTVFTGLGLYSTLKKFLLGQPEDREAVRRFEDFLSNRFFESHRVTLIPVEGDDTVHIQIGKEKQLPIYDLGDGLQNLITLTFHVFLQKEPGLFFMEEPETCMHPGFQRVLLQELTRVNHHQYFITTHSNHLLDMTVDFSDVSVYLFRKGSNGEAAKFSIELRSSKDHALLRELGVRNSSVFLSNATIWVEGITDRLYLRAFMSKYLGCLEQEKSPEAARFVQFLEDCHYSFVEYQGANVEHWAFDSADAADKKIPVGTLCARAFVLADGDIANKGDRRERLQRALGDRLEMLPCKEIENLVPEEIVRRIVAESFAKRGKDVAAIQYSRYFELKTGIGEYLDCILGDSVYAAPSGTLKNKMAFCESAIALMTSEDLEWQLPEPVRSLCKRIFDHIAACNTK